MDILVARDREYHSLFFVYPYEFYKENQEVLDTKQERVARGTIESDDLLYVLYTCRKNENFLYKANVVDTSTSWDAIKDKINYYLDDDQIIGLSVYTCKSGLACGCTLKLVDQKASYIHFRSSLASYTHIIDFYESFLQKAQ